MEDSLCSRLVPGATVEVTQQIPRRDYTWTDTVEGVVVSYEQRPTGSWYAHSKQDKLWLDRLVLRREDGEILTLNLDAYSGIKVLAPPTAAGAVAAEAGAASIKGPPT